jgi:hypothetical protein
VMACCEALRDNAAYPSLLPYSLPVPRS